MKKKIIHCRQLGSGHGRSGRGKRVLVAREGGVRWGWAAWQGDWPRGGGIRGQVEEGGVEGEVAAVVGR